MDIVRPPIPELIRVADLLDDAIGIYIKACASQSAATEWEAPLEGLVQSWLCVRNIEAVTILARTDEVLAPAAWANARNAFEISVRIVWLLYPQDRFVSEMRWMALLHEYERFHERMARSVIAEFFDHQAIASDLKDILGKIRDVTPDGYQPASGIPSIEAMLAEIGTPEAYRFYVEGSQFLHGSMAATHLFRRGIGTEKKFGDFSTSAEWILPLRICWLSLKTMSDFVIDRVYGKASMDWGSIKSNIDEAFHALARSLPPQ